MAQGHVGSKVWDAKPGTRWSQVANATGHRAFPQLHTKVTVPVTQLPAKCMERTSVQMLYIAWIESRMRCPVVGCESWAALDAEDKHAPPNPK